MNLFKKKKGSKSKENKKKMGGGGGGGGARVSELFLQRIQIYKNRGGGVGGAVGGGD